MDTPGVEGGLGDRIAVGSWFPALARLTTAMLTLYFVLAVGAHIRVRDSIVNAIPATSFLAIYAALTLKGPDRG